MGTPFSYRKFRGGLSVEYVGYQLEYDRTVAGISKKRAAWVIAWIDEAEKNGWMVQGRSFIEFTGRMSFIARVVTWLKPFLAPLFAWSPVLARGTVTRVPTMVYITLKFLKEQIQRHGHWVNAVAPWKTPRESFRTDAKCETNRVVLAGWSLEKGAEDLKLARWFCLEVLPSDLPMLFKEDGSSQWCSTAAELLASYAAAFAFGYLERKGDTRNLRIAITGGTDNKSNQGLQDKNMSTKWPLLAVHMQVSSELLSNGVRMKLRWRPREQNVPADALTNEDFALFDINKRVPFSIGGPGGGDTGGSGDDDSSSLQRKINEVLVNSRESRKQSPEVNADQQVLLKEVSLRKSHALPLPTVRSVMPAGCRRATVLVVHNPMEVMLAVLMRLA
eukprot:s469_g10.t1